MSDEFHPFLVFARPGELIVVLGEDMYQRSVTPQQLLNMGKQLIDTALFMAGERRDDAARP